MKKINTYIFTVIAAVVFFSCDDFLDTMPDNRLEINTKEKITQLLVSAYPKNSAALIAELSSDNARDNGSLYSPYNREQEDAYLWKEITSTGNDATKAVWEGHYAAIAAANAAIDAIDKMKNPADLEGQKGEALIARAYAHFALANVFCLPYNPQTANSDMGLPYSNKPETKVKIMYSRGNMEEFYAHIDKDIEAGLPLIKDEIYSVPKYHFNKAAACAFAARFYLFYHKYDKCIQYATEALGSNPEALISRWARIASMASNFKVRSDAYISADEAGNFILMPCYSSWPYVHGPYRIAERYGHHQSIFEKESVRANGPWGSMRNLYIANSVWGLEQKLLVTKIGPYFEYTDKAAGIGYLHSVTVPFTAGETLLCRAEAYILQSKFAEGVADINTWIKGNCTPTTSLKSQEDLVDFYEKIPFMPLQVEKDEERSIKKHINPQGFSVSQGVQENLIHCILHLRRIESVHEGGRWYDIKRYGIEISHNRDGLTDDILRKDDPRRAIQIPQDVRSAGLTPNPRN